MDRGLRDGAKACSADGTWDAETNQSHADAASLSSGNRQQVLWSADILIAEDHPVSRLVIEKLVSSLGYHVEVVNDGECALCALREKRFDLLLTDCLMPHVDGYELARRVRASDSEWSRLPILALTASVLSREEHACFAAGIDEVLIKPVDRVQLAGAIARWLRPGARAKVQRDRGEARTTPVRGVPREQPVLDWDWVNSVFGDERSSVRMLGFFLEMTQPIVQVLEQAGIGASSGDTAIRRQTHKLGGAARTAGAKELATLCDRIERAFDGADDVAIQGYLSLLRGAFGRLESAVEKARLQSDTAKNRVDGPIFD